MLAVVANRAHNPEVGRFDSPSRNQFLIFSMQEFVFQFPAFRDILALTPKNELGGPVLEASIKVGTAITSFVERRKIPLGWLAHEAFRTKIETEFGQKSFPAEIIQLVLNTTPVTRVCNAGKADERLAAPEIVIWTSLGGWFATRANQKFINPGVTTKFLQL